MSFSHECLSAALCHFYAVLALRESGLARSNLFGSLALEYTFVKSKFALVHISDLKPAYIALTECLLDTEIVLLMDMRLGSN